MAEYNMPAGYGKAQADYDAQLPPEPKRQESLSNSYKNLMMASVCLEDAGSSLDEYLIGTTEVTIWDQYEAACTRLDDLLSLIRIRLGGHPDA